MPDVTYFETITVQSLNECITITCDQNSATVEIVEEGKRQADILMTRRELVEMGRRMVALWRFPIEDDHPDFPDEFPDLTIIRNEGDQ